MKFGAPLGEGPRGEAGQGRPTPKSSVPRRVLGRRAGYATELLGLALAISLQNEAPPARARQDRPKLYFVL